ncbi:hypothetical protein SAMN05421805_103122 [Saccharopolyspora antimicrobica]|uniref:Uncharacterized protein n=1 Tax=Saccharopolyspora antimicrobica TaxID=455193 RepID=A0A1I4WYG5_9PSEU|nr:hypothetical protein [Saccharopolyspora antimicrobica]RKT84196.1 hypothetical protein ATL45_2506 [Saccharopolyspora antimicrobica]SFN18253.1 hypothetical protein SAMN05421805_103122 [Saccharopolyspora antimicrobica]
MELLDIEQRLVRMADGLEACPEVEIEHRNLGGLDPERADARSVLAAIADWYEVTLDESLLPAVARFEAFAVQWRTADPVVSGEFDLTYLLDAFGNPPPVLAHAATPEDERRLFSEFRVFDAPHRGGDGKLVSLRCGAADPEIWFFDVKRGTYRLDVDYAGYLEALLLTRGTYGWQHLLAEMSLRGSEFGWVVAAMKTMLRTFPALFPEDDFSPLRDRLRDRLR